MHRRRHQLHENRPSLLVRTLVATLPWLALGCEANLGSGATDSAVEDGEMGNPPVSAACDGDRLGQQPLRRLSSLQYENTLRDLFGDELGRRLNQDSLFPVTIIDRGFHADAEANTVNTAESNAIEDNAERIATVVLDDPDPFLEQLLPCDVSSTSSTEEIASCLGPFIDDFGRRAYRRPLTAAEAGIVRRVFEEVSADQGGVAGFSAVLQLMVQSPALLYRVERGDGVTSDGHVRLSSYEMASRLSYFLTDSMPDDALFEAAAADELRTVQQIRTHADRLAGTPAFLGTMQRLLEDWLHLYELSDAPKDPEVFPRFSPAVRAALLEETGRLLRATLDEGDGSLRTLLGSASLPVSAETESLYGVSGVDGWQTLEVPGRVGLLSQASVMAVLAEADRTSPIHRGAVFVRDVLCESLPALPGDVDTATALEDTSGRPTARERLAPLLESPGCRTCHQAFNPVGLAFENYDAVGAWRDEENGSPIDASGTFRLDGEEVAFSGPEELLHRIAESEKVRDCFSLQAFRAMKGRRESADDSCSVERARTAAADSGGDLRETLLALVETPAFLYRTGDGN